MSKSVVVTDDHPVDPDDELLVAYLDDELEDAERRAVEKRLVDEPALRQRLQTLQTGWEWLEELPEESTNEKLVESTIELAVADIMPGKGSQESWFNKHWKTIGFVSMLLAVFLAGAIGTTIAKRNAFELELKELEIAENVEAYKLGSDFTLIRELMYDDRWQGMLQTIQQVGEYEMTPRSVVASIPIQKREDNLRTLPNEMRERLAGRWATYSSFDDGTKTSLRQTANKVNAQDDADDILETMKAASVWMESLDEDLRDQMRSDDRPTRRSAIAEAIDITMAKLVRNSGKMISDETSDQIYLWLHLLYHQRLEESPELQSRVAQFKRYMSQQGRPEEWVDQFHMRAMLDDRDWRGRSRGGFSSMGRMPPGPPNPPPEKSPSTSQSDSDDSEQDGDEAANVRPPPGRRPPPTRTPPITEREFTDLQHLLNAEALRDLNALTNLSSPLVGDAVINETLRSWAFESLRRNEPYTDSGESTPLDRYRRAREDRGDRDELDLMPPEVIVNEVFTPKRRRSR